MSPRYRPTVPTSARLLFACAIAIPVLSLPGTAAAQEEPEDAPGGEEIQFDYGIDGVSWYWSRQIDETFELGDIAQPIELPNPQSATTMPIAVEFGEATKVAALQFNLAERGVPEGSTINDFQLTVAEGDDTGDSPTFNPAQNVIEACPITEPWSTGEAEMWDVQPAIGDECVTGERAEPDPEELTEAEGLDDLQQPLPNWTFDLTEMATEWGQDPFSSFGVMFMPVLDEATPIDLWQVNLKLPMRDDSDTEADEYEDTIDRLSATMSYEPGPEEEAEDGADDLDGGSGGDTAGSAGSGGGGDGTEGEEAPAEEDEEAAEDEIAPAAFEPTAPSMPWYVWTLIPAALLGAYLLNTVMGSSAAAPSGGGAIDRIRSHNLDRRGWPLPVPPGVWARLTGRGEGR